MFARAQGQGSGVFCGVNPPSAVATANATRRTLENRCVPVIAETTVGAPVPGKDIVFTAPAPIPERRSPVIGFKHDRETLQSERFMMQRVKLN